jgi:hypothetical protein
MQRAGAPPPGSYAPNALIRHAHCFGVDFRHGSRPCALDLKSASPRSVCVDAAESGGRVGGARLPAPSEVGKRTVAAWGPSCR